MLAAGALDGDRHLRVRDVGAVPGEQEVHAMDGGESDVGGIRRRFGRKGERGNESRRQIAGLIGDVEQGKVMESRQPFASGLYVAGAGFIQNELGDVDVEVVTPGLPPFPGDLLMTSPNEISAGPCRQVARHGRFQVELRFHRRRFG